MIPSPVGKSYLPYQIEGIQFALTRKSTLIADDMGLGKSCMSLGIINANSDIKTVLIVCPASLTINWWNEIDAWLVNDWRVTGNGPHITVMSYEASTKVSTSIDLLIVDEAHYTKNPKSKRSKAVSRISKFAKQIVYLTGTPIENKPVELWPLLQVLDPLTWDPAGRAKINKKYVMVGPGEGAGFFKFALRYCGAHKEKRGEKSYWIFDGSSNLEELQKRLRDTIMIRRMKSEVLSQLPAKRRQIIVLPNADIIADAEIEQNDIRNNILAVLPDLTELNYEESIKKLQSNKIAFAEYSKRRHDDGVKKVELVAEHVIRSLEETDKIILFAHHSDVILELAEQLVFYGCVHMTGETPISERQAAVNSFMTDPNCKVIIGSIGTMGVGWTLTAASLVIFAELDTVPGKMNQAEDRAHRIGQENSVLVQHLVLNGSIDARICKILVKKQGVVNAVLNPHDDQMIKVQEIREKWRKEPIGEGWTAEDIAKEVAPWDGLPSKLAERCDHPHKSIKAMGARYVCEACNTVMR